MLTRFQPLSAPGIPTYRPCRSPDRQASIERRRVVAGYGMAPNFIRAKFTQGEMAALTIMADAVRARGYCDDCIDAIAARAGVHRTTVQNAFRLAEALGFIKVRHRPARIRGRKSLTNVVTIINAEWLDWIRKRRRPLPGMRRPGVGSKDTQTRKMSTSYTVVKKEKRLGEGDPGLENAIQRLLKLKPAPVPGS
jgi:hypothetical protein